VRISGTTTVAAPRRPFWDALQDPAVLARTLPGCESLEVLGEDHYAATVTAGVASVKGTYSGKVQLHDKLAPDSCRLQAEGAGAPGTIRADVHLRLEDDGAGTVVHYEADAVVGGMIGGVGQRMIGAAARRTAAEFFGAVADEVVRGPAVAAVPAPGVPAPGAPAPGIPAPGVPALAGAPGAAVPGEAAPGAAPAVGQVFRGAAPEVSSEASRRSLELFGAFALGAAVALVGVLVGRRSARADGGRRS
jgi:uncharacterized protein